MRGAAQILEFPATHPSVLTVHIRRRGSIEFEWIAIYGHEQVASGRDLGLADCLRSAADVLLPTVTQIQCKVVYQERVAGPIPVSRLLDADELADHLKELAGER